MTSVAWPIEWILGFILILASLGVILAPKPIHASLSFLLVLLALTAFYLNLSAEFIAVMQLLVYAGAILVIFVFVILLFQDAHAQISRYIAQSWLFLLVSAAVLFPLILAFLAYAFMHNSFETHTLPQEFGTVEALGQELYRQFFFPFEAATIIFLIAIVGSLYIAKKES